MVKTNIIATLGPASSSETVLRNMMRAGLDVVRLNFSHGTHDAHAERIKTVRALNDKYRRHIKVLQDLEGYRIRIGTFEGRDEHPLKRKETVVLTNDHSRFGDDVLPFDYESALTDIDPGSYIYIDDGTIVLRVIESHEHELSAEVVIPGVVKVHKGVNIPGIHLNFQGLTEKDQHDVLFGIEAGVDFIAQSFVRSKEDILALRTFINERNFDCKIIAKIENREGVENLDEIMDAADGIMVARGDLGVSLPIYLIPVLQKYIIAKCNSRKKIVITATQMLESMTDQTRPLRSEVTDVANAVIDGTDFVMLSGETAVGHDPAAVVSMMNDILKHTEEYLRTGKLML